MQSQRQRVPRPASPPAALSFGATRTVFRRGRLLVAIPVVLALAGVVVAAKAVLGPHAAAPLGVTAAHAAAAPSPSPTPPAPGTEPFARVRGLTLYLPLTDPIGVFFHEASSNESLALVPEGRCARNWNRTKYRCRPASAGPVYRVMSSRGRPHPATSAVDVAIERGGVARSPVTAAVLNVKRYRLYGRYPDLRLYLRPLDHPQLRVVVLHLMDVRVRRGQTIYAGVTPIGSPRVFPFRSQVNDYVGPGIPHIHMEVKLLGDQG